MTRHDQFARDLWAAEVRERRKRAHDATWLDTAPGYPRMHSEGPNLNYSVDADEYMDEVRAALNCEVTGYDYSHGYTDALRRMREKGVAEWFTFNRKLVEGGHAIGRGRMGPLYPFTWWRTMSWPNKDTSDHPMERQLFIAPDLEKRLPQKIEDRAVFLALTHIAGATVRWRVRRETGRTDAELLHDVDQECSSVGSFDLPWRGEWWGGTVNGREQEQHGWGTRCGVRIRAPGAGYDDVVKIKEKQIISIARRIFRLPTLYVAGVDTETGQAAFF